MSNKNALLKRNFCAEWIHDMSARSVKMYMQINGLPLRCRLLMDNDLYPLPNLDHKL